MLLVLRMHALANFLRCVAHVRLCAIEVNILMQDDLSSRTNVPIVLPLKSQSESNLAVCKSSNLGLGAF